MNAGSGRAALRRLVGRWRFRIWIALGVVLGVALGFVPLFGVLGFELALVAAVFASIAGLDLGAALARELQWTEPTIERASYPGRMLARSTLAASLLAVAVAIVPGAICAIRGIWVPTCDWTFGLTAYAAMPLASAALAGAMGHAIAVAVGSRPRGESARDRPIALAFAVFAGIVVSAGSETITGAIFVGIGVAVLLGAVLWLLAPHRSTLLALAIPIVVCAATGLYQFYAAPPVFTYNAIIGYFPGNLYDENIQLEMPLVWSRLEQLAWVLAIVAAVAARLDVPRYRVARWARPIGRRVAPFALAALCATAAVGLRLHAGDLGYSIDGDEIAAELGGVIETEHFVIHYAKTADIEKDIALLAADHELRYAQVVAQLGAAPAGKIRSFYFSGREQKARWIGAKDVEMAKPWRREIYLEHRAFPHGSLRHEIAHAVASEFGDPIFGVAMKRIAGMPLMASPGLIEGLAVAADWPSGYDRLTPHEAVRAMQVMGMTPTIRELLSLQFLTVSSARSYTTAGSFLRFLLDTYGAPALRALYANGGDFDSAYGKSIGVLEAEWRAKIATISLPPDVVEGTRERFRHGSVFARPCPHANAARRERAAWALVSGDRARAIALARTVCADAPDEPRYRLELGDYLAGGNAMEKREALAIWTSIATSDQVTSSLRADAFERLAREASRSGDLAKTIALVGQARTLGVDPNARRQLDAEWFALHHEGPAGPALRGYFFAPPGSFDSPEWALLATIGEPELGFGHYLLGLQKSNAGEWAAAAESLDRALSLPLPGAPFAKNGARKLAVAAYRANDRPRVARAIEVLRGPGMSETDHLLADDWEQRVIFDTSKRLH